MYEKKPVLPIPAIIVLCIIGSAWALYFTNSRNNQTEEAIRQSEENFDVGMTRQSGPEAGSDRTKDLQRMMYQQPEEALALAETILADPQNTDEIAFAQDKLPNILNILANNAIKEEDNATAKEYLTRLETEHPDHIQTRSALRSFENHLLNKAGNYLRAGNEEKLQEYFQLAIDEKAFGEASESFLKNYQRDRMDKWKAARDAGDTQAANQHMLDAMGVITDIFPSSIIVDYLRKNDSTLGKEYLEQGDIFYQQQAYPAAIHNYHVAYQKLRHDKTTYFGEMESYPNYEETQVIMVDLQKRWLDAGMAMASMTNDDGHGIVTSLTPLETYRQ